MKHAELVMSLVDQLGLEAKAAFNAAKDAQKDDSGYVNIIKRTTITTDVMTSTTINYGKY